MNRLEDNLLAESFVDTDDFTPVYDLPFDQKNQEEQIEPAFIEPAQKAVQEPIHEEAEELKEAVPQPQTDTTLNYPYFIKKSAIHEACPDLPAAKRKNVSKYLVRDILRVMSKKPSKYATKAHLSPEELECIKLACGQVEGIEKQRKAQESRKNYVQVIDRMVQVPPFRRVFRERLNELLKKFKYGKFGRIGTSRKGGNNQETQNTYKKTVQCLYDFVSTMP